VKANGKIKSNKSTAQKVSTDARREFLLQACIGVAAAGVGQVAMAATSGQSGSDEEQIKELFASLMRAVKKEDAAGVAEHYAPEGFIYLDVSTPRAFYGREGGRKTWAAWFSLIEPGSGGGEATQLKVTVAGDHAFAMHFDHYWAKPKDPKLAHLRDFTNRATSWLQKIGGKWYILVEHNSFPVDLVTRQADLLSKE
jgi:ketosteroid isomerase-like protein